MMHLLDYFSPMAKNDSDSLRSKERCASRGHQLYIYLTMHTTCLVRDTRMIETYK